MPIFQRNSHPVRFKTERFFNTDWLILFIPMEWTHFQSGKRGKSHEKLLQTLYSFCKKSCFAMPSFQRNIHPVWLKNGKIFQHRLIDFIHRKAKNPFSKLTNGEKVMKSCYKPFIVFAKNRASPCQHFNVILIQSGSDRKDFSTQTDWFYSYQHNHRDSQGRRKGPCDPQIFGKYSHFVLWEAFFPDKIVLFA